jgi:hypothetical protein
VTDNKKTLDEYQRTLYCACCFTAHLLDDAGDCLGFICPECRWEWDGRSMTDTEEVSAVFGPNMVELVQARKNYDLYGADDAHGYWCKHYRDLPAGVDEREPNALFLWRLAARCHACDVFAAPGDVCPECGE